MTQGVSLTTEELRKLLSCGCPDAALLYLYCKAELPRETALDALHFTVPRMVAATDCLKQLGLWQEQAPRHVQPETPRYTEEELRKRLAQTQARMAAAVERQLSLSRQRLEALAGKRVLQSPMNYLQDKRMTLEYSRERLSSASQRLMQAKREQFVRLTAKLDAMSPLKVLSRGYSVVRTEDGSVLRRAADARPGDRIQIDLMQGTLLAEVSQVLEAEDA